MYACIVNFSVVLAKYLMNYWTNVLQVTQFKMAVTSTIIIQHNYNSVRFTDIELKSDVVADSHK